MGFRGGGGRGLWAGRGMVLICGFRGCRGFGPLCQGLRD